mmetsp:Transcript_65471/g.205157  ORF Transcript_65471/g.205157 Transcript_65471/m.205157 type:complete len:273 (+) Transcript_65471:26-844(+)
MHARTHADRGRAGQSLDTARVGAPVAKPRCARARTRAQTPTHSSGQARQSRSGRRGCALLGGVGDLLRSRGILERHDRLVQVGAGRRAIHKHQRLGRAPQRVLHELGQLVVPVGHDLLLAFRQCFDHVPQRGERLVDLDGLLLAFLVDLGLLDPLGAGQVAYQDLPLELLLRLSVGALDLDDQHQVRAGAFAVHRCAGHRPLLVSSLEQAGQLLGSLALLVNQPLHGDRAGLLHANVELGLGGASLSLVEQVHKVVPVQLQHGAAHLVLEAL